MGEWDAWEPQEPPRGFAERVVAEAVREDRAREAAARRQRRMRHLGFGVLATVAAAAVVAIVVRPAARGGAIAGDEQASAREQVEIGQRAIAVLEPGAHVSWSGDEVTQTAGDVFYRVEKSNGATRPFVVHTGAGDVTVKGTCFRVKVGEMKRREVISAAAGAAASAMVLVGVYEGKVMASHGSAAVDVAAGESARLDAKGATKAGDLSVVENDQSASASPSATADDPLLAANQNLADQVRAYKRRLEANEAEKTKLESRLKEAEAKLAADPSAKPLKSEYDLSQDDWKQLAAEGTIKSRYPCAPPEATKLGDDAVQELGLSPDDAATVWKAYRATEQHLHDVIMPLCVQVLGNADLASRLSSSCEAIIHNASPNDQAVKDVRLVADMRAGNVPMPGPNDKLDPYARLLLAQTGAMKDFEGELAKSFGPDEAHRIAFSDDLGMCSSVNSTGPRPKMPR